MKRISALVVIIMIHSGYGVLAASAVDFHKEIEMVTQDQFDTHQKTLSKIQATEAAFDFENTYRKPAPTKALTFFPLRLRAKPATKKTKVAASKTATSNSTSSSRAYMIQLYREQVL